MVKNFLYKYGVLTVLVIVKLAISLPFITTNPIDLDEPFSIYYAHYSLHDLIQLFQYENNPPLHFILLHFWENLFGTGPVAVRSLSLLFSILTIPVLWVTALKISKKKGAILTTLLFIFSDFQHYFGLEARTYSLLTFEFSLLIYFLTAILINKKQNFSNYIMLGIINLSLFYTHYISLFVLASEFIVFLIFYKKINLKKTFITAFIFLIGIAPWISVLYTRIHAVDKGGTWLQTAQYSELYGLINKFFNDKWALLALICSIIFISLLQYKKIFQAYKSKISVALLMLILFVIPYFTVFILSRTGSVNLFYDRYLFFLVLPLYFIIAELFQRTKVSMYVFFVFFLVYLIRFDYKPDNNRDGNQLAAFVKNEHVKTVVIAPEYYMYTFAYHYDQILFLQKGLFEQAAKKQIFTLFSQQDFDSKNMSGKIAFIDADFDFTHPEAHLDDWFIKHGYNLIASSDFKGNYHVKIYQSSEQ